MLLSQMYILYAKPHPLEINQYTLGPLVRSVRQLCVVCVNLAMCIVPSQPLSQYPHAGIALLHYHLATSLYNDNPSDSSTHLQQAAKLLQPSLSHLDAHRFTFLCGAGGPLALGAVVYAKLGESTTSKQCIDSLRELYARNKTTFPQLPSELLYGHAGYLYSLLFVNHAIPGAIEESLVTEVVETVLSCGEKGREDQIQSPMMYTWHHKHYLGAAHGLVGILTLLLQVSIVCLVIME